MKKIKKIEIKKPFKFFILTLAILTAAYFFTALKESFNSFEVESVKNQNYCTKKQDRFLLFYDDAAGQYIEEGSPRFFAYTISDGKIQLFDFGSEEDPWMTLFYVKSGLYSKTNHIYFYPY